MFSIFVFDGLYFIKFVFVDLGRVAQVVLNSPCISIEI